MLQSLASLVQLLLLRLQHLLLFLCSRSLLFDFSFFPGNGARLPFNSPVDASNARLQLSRVLLLARFVDLGNRSSAFLELELRSFIVGELL